MDKKNEFKEFVKNNPSLLKFVNNEKMTWQKFYEMYDLYGENSEVWNEYIKPKQNEEKKTTIYHDGITASYTLSFRTDNGGRAHMGERSRKTQ